MSKERWVVGVDDNDIDRGALERAGAALDIELTIAESGNELLELLLAPDAATPPKVVIVDLNLPDMRGEDVLRRIRESSALALLPVVIVSASRDPSSARMCYEIGANAYVVKPRGFLELVEVYRTCLSFWQSCVTGVQSPQF